MEGEEREGWKEGSGNWAARGIVFFSFNDDISPGNIEECTHPIRLVISSDSLMNAYPGVHSIILT